MFMVLAFNTVILKVTAFQELVIAFMDCDKTTLHYCVFTEIFQ